MIEVIKRRAKFVFLTVFVMHLFACAVFAESKLEVQPSSWWTGMKLNKIQLLIHGDNIGDSKASTSYVGVTITKSYSLTSGNYLFVNLEIAESAKPALINIELSKGKRTQIVKFELLPNPNHKPASISQKDVIYLIMPDRFANGDTTNDNMDGFLDKLNRKNETGRHGGDLKGIENHLDYFPKIGVNTLWLNPVIENNMRSHSYHGYAFTNFYKVDARFGTNKDYARLNQKIHSSKLKVIKDLVLNHIGLSHPWMTDIPDTSWVHRYSGNHLNCNFRASTLTDPHAAKIDVDKMQTGWFSNSMPDLNQKCPELATYLIQNTIWWITSASLDGIRLDTYPYPDKSFLKDWTEAVQREYPGFYIVGEIWVPTPSMEAYWLNGAKNQDGYSASLPAATDFALQGAFSSSINDGSGWDNGWTKVYGVLAHDFVYNDAETNMIFLDNHDMARLTHTVKNNVDKLKLGLAFLYTTRGIPQVYYGTELLWNGDGNNHGKIRMDMLGGWANDSVDIFAGKGLTSNQQEVMTLMKKLGDLRQTHECIGSGKLVHYIPEDNIYVYFRSFGTKSVMVILNGNDKVKLWNKKRYVQNLGSAVMGTDLMTGSNISLEEGISVAAFGFKIIEINQ